MTQYLPLCLYRWRNRTTRIGCAKRHDARLLADGRDAIAAVLIASTPGLSWNNITAAIRAGHVGTATNFTAINREGAVALGYTFSN